MANKTEEISAQRNKANIKNGGDGCTMYRSDGDFWFQPLKGVVV